MTRAICLRCDWEGSTSARGCPTCGAPLYRPSSPSRRRERRPPEHARLEASQPTATPSPRSPAQPKEPLSGEPGRARRGRSARSLAGVVAAVLLVGFVVSRVSSSTAPERGAGSTVLFPAVHVGTLVYASDAGAPAGKQVVWVLDLATGEAREGPTIPIATGLYDATYAGPSWLGASVSARDGSSKALLLRGTSRSVRPASLGSGSLLAWGPSGRTVAIAHRGEPDAHGCRRIWIDVVTVQTGLSERVLDQRTCGDLSSIGRGWAATYLTWVSTRTVIDYVGLSGVRHPVLRGFELLSVSPNSDLLCEPAQGARGAVLFWRGRGGPLRIGSAGGDLMIHRVLAWAPDGSRVVVDGRQFDTRGLFEIQAGPGPSSEPREPRFLTGTKPGQEETAAAYAGDGTLYLSVGGYLIRDDGGELRSVRLPSGAPPPAGPIAWLP